MRPTHIRIDLTRLRHNFSIARQHHGGRLLAVVKADAYGHGAIACAHALADVADGFAVATLEEGLALRQAGIALPIVLLEGCFSPEDRALTLAHDMTPVVHTAWQAEQMLAATAGAQAPPVWIKVDTGMHRLGFAPEALPALVRRFRQQGQRTLVAMTHFAHADGLSPHALDAPLALFRQAIAGLGVETSLSNSGAILGYPQSHGDWGRPGLMLYGLDPASPGIAPRAGLLPVMSLRSRLMTERTIAAGESVGYGALFTATRRSRIGVIPCGYADGYPRTAPQGTPVHVGGQIVPLVGRVSMDMLTVDLTEAPGVQVGDAVELWGDQVPVATLAHTLGTLSYELVCQARRAPRQHIHA